MSTFPFLSIRAALLAVVLFFIAGTMSAQSVTVEDGAVHLSLEEAVALSLERNLGLKVERFRLQESEWALSGSQGIYDLNLTGRLSAFDEASPSASNLDGADIQISEQQGWVLGLEQLVTTGGRLNLDWNNSRFESNSRFASLNPRYRSDLDLTFTQPLLRDLGKDSTDYRIKVARNNLEISKETFERQVTTTVSTAKQLYWNLVDAKRQLEVDTDSLGLAQRLHQQNDIKVEVGTMAPLELVQSKVGVAERDEAVIRSEAAVFNAEDALRQFLSMESEYWAMAIEPTTPAETETMSIDVDAGIAAALEYRPDLRTQRLSIDNLMLDEEFYLNQRLPRLDLSATYGYNGLGGDVTNRDFFTGEILDQSSGSYSDALNQVTGGDFDGWNVALNLVMPIQNRSAEAQSAISSIARERGEAELADLEATISAEVRRIARTVQTAAALIESTTASRGLAEENLSAEEKRFENGLSTSYQVLEIQENLTQARTREVLAITGYRKAYVEYLRVTGQLLEDAGIDVGTDQ